MSTKKNSKKITTNKPKTMEAQVDKELAVLADMLFHPTGKNPYYLDGKALNSLHELVDNLNAFTGNEGPWVAAWLEYLGDKEVAALIQESSGDFKLIVIDRYTKLKKQHSCEKCEKVKQ
jgi:hypothetical protein